MREEYGPVQPGRGLDAEPVPPLLLEQAERRPRRRPRIPAPAPPGGGAARRHRPRTPPDLPARRAAVREHAVAGLEAELRQWAAMSRAGGPLEKHRSQLDAVGALFGAAVADVRVRLADGRAREVPGRVLDLHHVWDFYRTRFLLRQVRAYRRFLDVADELAWETYGPVVRLAGCPAHGAAARRLQPGGLAAGPPQGRRLPRSAAPGRHPHARGPGGRGRAAVPGDRRALVLRLPSARPADRGARGRPPRRRRLRPRRGDRRAGRGRRSGSGPARALGALGGRGVRRRVRRRAVRPRLRRRTRRPARQRRRRRG
ncbi:hypothetical protein ACQ4WX_43210 [Streptomyces lasalocidi]